MNYHKKLIDFMKLKASFLPKPYNRYYMTNGDAKDVMKWSEDDAKYVYDKLLKKIKMKKFSAIDSCIFCIYSRQTGQYRRYRYTDCESCSYKKRHGLCGSFDSLYGKMYSKGIRVIDIIYDNHNMFINFLTKEDDNEETEITKIN